MSTDSEVRHQPWSGAALTLSGRKAALLSRTALLTAGHTDTEIPTFVRRGTMHRLAPGAHRLPLVRVWATRRTPGAGVAETVAAVGRHRRRPHRPRRPGLGPGSASLAELQFGVLVTNDQAVRAARLRRLSHLRRTFDALPIETLCPSRRSAHRDALPIDEDVATSNGELAAAVAAGGREPRSRVMDLLIAATAHTHAARLYTRNAADLTGIEHLVEVVGV